MNFRPAIQSHNERWPLASQHQTTTVIIGMFFPFGKNVPFKEKKREKEKESIASSIIRRPIYLRKLVFARFLHGPRANFIDIGDIIIIIIIIIIIAISTFRNRQRLLQRFARILINSKQPRALTHARTLCTALFSSRYCSIFHYHKCATGATTATTVSYRIVSYGTVVSMISARVSIFFPRSGFCYIHLGNEKRGCEIIRERENHYIFSFDVEDV